MARMRDADVVRRRRLGPRAGASKYPPTTILVASLLSVLPVFTPGAWWPDLAFLVLVAWRLRRTDAFPGWWAVPFGLFNDLVTGQPIGLSVVTFTLAMIVITFADIRLRWRSHWTEWAVAAVLVALAELVEWQANAFSGAPSPIRSLLPAIAIGALVFPLVALLIEKIDDFRLRR